MMMLAVSTTILIGLGLLTVGAPLANIAMNWLGTPSNPNVSSDVPSTDLAGGALGIVSQFLGLLTSPMFLSIITLLIVLQLISVVTNIMKR